MENPPIIARLAPELVGEVAAPVLAAEDPAEWVQGDYDEARSTASNALEFGLVDAMAGGILIPLMCDIEITDKGWTWGEWKPPSTMRYRLHQRTPVMGFPAGQTKGSPMELPPGKTFVVWNNYWLFELPLGWGMLVTHPAGRLDLPYEVLPGLIDCHAFWDFPISFTSRWIDPDFRGVLKAGTPIAQIYPVPIQSPKLKVEA